MALNDHRSKMNAPKVMKACEKALLWDEAVFLLKEDEQYDSAVKTMIAHPSAFRHDLFLDCAQKVRNAEVYYKAIQFYVEQQPLQLNRLLQVLTPNLDHSRVTHQLRKLENLPLALPYLRDVQKENLTAVNDAVNELCVDDEDYDALRSSINDFDNFDHIALAQKVEKHELLEIRNISEKFIKSNDNREHVIEEIFNSCVRDSWEIKKNMTGVMSGILNDQYNELKKLPLNWIRLLGAGSGGYEIPAKGA